MYPMAVATTPLPRPSLLAIPPSAVLPSALSTCGPASAAPSPLPSHEVTSEPSPADLNLSRNPPTPPGDPVIRCTISCISWPAFGPSPNRPATSSIALSIIAILLSHKAHTDTCFPRLVLWSLLTLLQVVSQAVPVCGRGWLRTDTWSAAQPRPPRSCPRRTMRRGPLFAECSLCPRCCQGSAVRSEALDLHLLAADLVVHGLDMVAADLLQPDFFDHARSLVDQRLLSGLADFERGVRPIDIADVFGVGNRAPQNLGMFLVQGYVCGDLLFRHKPAHPRHAGLDHPLADQKLLFGEPQHLVVRLGQFGRHRNLLHGGNRRRGDRSRRGFDLGDRS